MKLNKPRLKQIILEEIGRLDRADEPPGGWTTTKDRGGRKRPLRKTVPVGDPKKKRDYDEEDILAMQHGNPEGSPLEETEEDPERLLRREIRESKRALAAAMKNFVQLQNEQPGTRPEWGPRMLSKFVDNWIMERA